MTDRSSATARSCLAGRCARHGLLTIGLLLIAGTALGDPEPELRSRAQGLLRDTVAQTLRGEALDDAEAKLAEALHIFRDLGDLRGEAETERSLGALLANQQSYGRARGHLQRSAELWHQQGNRFGAWFSLFSLGEASRFSGFCPDALAAFDKADRVLEEISADPSEPIDLDALAGLSGGLGMPGLADMPAPMVALARPFLIASVRAQTLLGRAGCLADLGSYKDALAALDKVERLPAAVDWVVAKVQRAKAEIHLARGAGEEAAAAFEEAIHKAREAIKETERTLSRFGQSVELPPAVRADELLALEGLASAQRALGKGREALATLQTGLVLERMVGNPTLRARLLGRFGVLLLDQGRPAAARQRFEQGLALAREQGARDAEAMLLGFLAELEALAGSYGQALAWHFEALDVVHSMGHRAQEAQMLLQIAWTEVRLRQLRSAYGRFEQALAIARELDSPDLELEALLGAAGIGDELESGRGIDLVLQALELAASKVMPRFQAEALTLLGWMQIRAGKTAEALASFEQARGLGRWLDLPLIEGGADLGVGLALHRLARGEEAAVAVGRATFLLASAGNQSEVVLAELALGVMHRQTGDEESAIEAWSEVAERLDARLGMVPSSELSASFAGLLPTSVHAALVDLHSARGDVDAAFLHAERSRSRALLGRLGGAWTVRALGGETALGAWARDAAERVEQTERLLEQANKEHFGQPSPRSQQLARELGEQRETLRQAKVELVLRQPEVASLATVDAVDLAAVRDEILRSGQTLVAYYVLADRVVAWVVDRDRAKMLSLDERRDELESNVRELRASVASRHERGPLLAMLYDQLIAPLRPHIRHRDVVLVPHGVLHGVPFAALWHENSGRYLAEELTLTYAPSASSLRFLAGKGSNRSGRALVLGSPDGSLPQAREEAQTIARLYGVVPLLGPEASEARLRSELKAGVDLVHLAAHAEWNDQNPPHSRLLLAPGGGEDGALEVHEVLAELDLRGVGLVVLSACATASAQGRSAPGDAGDELVGLSRAFIAAGSQAVVATAWKIDDRSSRFLMETFHGHLQAGLAAADALREAQVTTRYQEGWSAPYFWAAFALYGDGRTILDFRATLDSSTYTAEKGIGQ